jgi:hypothetical protein
MIDQINPAHYRDGKIEVIDYIEDKGFGYNLGNVIKYVSRAGKKSDKIVEDLEKAKWYLEREINKLKNSKNIDYENRNEKK